jgi:hypothetical protein
MRSMRGATMQFESRNRPVRRDRLRFGKFQRSEHVVIEDPHAAGASAHGL